MVACGPLLLCIWVGGQGPGTQLCVRCGFHMTFGTVRSLVPVIDVLASVLLCACSNDKLQLAAAALLSLLLCPSLDDTPCCCCQGGRAQLAYLTFLCSTPSLPKRQSVVGQANNSTAVQHLALLYLRIYIVPSSSQCSPTWSALAMRTERHSRSAGLRTLHFIGIHANK